MARQRLLVEDPRWAGFVERYAFDLNRFAVEVVGMDPTHQQIELNDALSPPGSRVSISSGHGTGKSREIGVICTWHLLCYYKSNTLLTAPKIEQVKNVAWKEIADVMDLIQRGPFGWICDYYAVEAERIYVKGYKMGWFVIAKTAPRGSPENLAGMHRDWYLVVADEASGIPDQNFKVLTGALTDKRNRMALFSQPTRDSGYFYDTHNKLSAFQKDEHGNYGPWVSLVFNSEESPLVSKEFIKEKELEYGGRDSVEFWIRVLGKFPESNDKYLVGRKAIERCIGAEHVVGAGAYAKDEWGYIATVDVAAGEYRDKSVLMIGKVVNNGDGIDPRRVDIIDIPICSNILDLDDFAGQIVEVVGQFTNISVYVDAGGMGVGVCQRLEKLEIPNVTRVLWGKPCFRKEYKDRFINVRAQCNVFAANAIKKCRLTIIDKRRKDLMDQGGRIPRHFNEKAQSVIASKEEMRSEGLPSPDLWDCVAMFFMEDAHYIQHEGAINYEAEDNREKAVDAVDDAFADLEDTEEQTQQEPVDD